MILVLFILLLLILILAPFYNFLSCIYPNKNFYRKSIISFSLIFIKANFPIFIIIFYCLFLSIATIFSLPFNLCTEFYLEDVYSRIGCIVANSNSTVSCWLDPQSFNLVEWWNSSKSHSLCGKHHTNLVVSFNPGELVNFSSPDQPCNEVIDFLNSNSFNPLCSSSSSLIPNTKLLFSLLISSLFVALVLRRVL